MKNFVFFFTLAFALTMNSCTQYPDLGSGYKLDNDGKYSSQIVNFENTIIVSPHILEYTFDSTFIILSQRPWDSIPNRRTMNYIESNKAFEKSTFRQYWIINKKERSEYSLDTLSNIVRYSNVYGPFNKHEYIKKLVELRVPQDLVIKIE